VWSIRKIIDKNCIGDVYFEVHKWTGFEVFMVLTEDCYILECETVRSDRSSLMFWSNVSSPTKPHGVTFHKVVTSIHD
jgi:hypothetical protein